MDDIEEYKALTSVFSAYYHFHQWEYDQLIKPRGIKYNSLPPDEQRLLPWYTQHTESLKQAINTNKQFTQFVALTICKQFGIEESPSSWYEAGHDDFDKVRSILLQLKREWGDEGEHERLVFERMICELNHKYPDFSARQHVNVLLPGCGLGRLVFEVVRNGYRAQGNEFSYHMLIMANFMLNFCSHPFQIHPYLHKFSNVCNRADQLRSVVILNHAGGTNGFEQLMLAHPDVPFMELMSMAAGSFTDLYGPDSLTTNSTSPNEFRATNKAHFEAVLTCFFLDTASNIIEYLKTIAYCLKKSGIWINLGPLLWHFENDFNTSHITLPSGEQVPTIMKGLELSRADLIQLIEDMGFQFEKMDTHEQRTVTIYAADPRLLSNFTYHCEFWICSQ